MSLYLPEQKLGSHSQPDSSSHKFMLKGRQTGAMHRGHAWVFRAESHDTMMAWFDDIANLIGKTGEARNAFVRRHMRTLSGNSFRDSSISSDGVMDEDEADRTPYSGNSAVFQRAPPTAADVSQQRPQPGGRFPSDVQIDRNLQATLSRSSGESSAGREALADATALPGSGVPFVPNHQPVQDSIASNQASLPYRAANNDHLLGQSDRHDSYYGDWMGTSVGNHNYENAKSASNGPVLAAAPVYHPVSSPSQAPIVVATTAVNPAPSGYTDMDGGSTAPPSVNPTEHTNTTALTSVYAGEEGLKDGQPLAGEESARSRHSQSTFSMMDSTPTSMGTSPFSDSAARPAVTQESSSTFDLGMPGNYPRTST